MREATVPIDPFVDVVDGRCVDELVVVQPIASSWPARGRGSVRTPHFDIAPSDGRLVVTHSLSRSGISDELSGVIVDELFVAEALRSAARRVVVAVPFEEEANESYGHVRTLTLDDLAALGVATAERSAFSWSVHVFHGGWLVFDRRA